MLRSAALLAVMSVVLAGCIAAGSASDPTPSSRDERVSQHFAGVGESIMIKESMAGSPGYVMVDEQTLTDGTIRSLWATVPGVYRSRCFYVDEESADGNYSGFGGCGGGGGKEVTLGGNAAVMIGETGAWPAVQARIVARGAERVVLVRNGYFLVPEEIILTGAKHFRIVLFDQTGAVVVDLPDVPTPGS